MLSYKRASTDFVMNDLNRIEKTMIGIDHDGPNNSAVNMLSSICRLVVSVIPTLLRLGLIDRFGCVVLGAVIGIVVALGRCNSDPINLATRLYIAWFPEYFGGACRHHRRSILYLLGQAR